MTDFGGARDLRDSTAADRHHAGSILCSQIAIVSDLDEIGKLQAYRRIHVVLLPLHELFW